MKYYFTFSFILATTFSCFSQKWSKWENDTTYSITGKKRIHSLRKKVNSKLNTYQEVWFYFDQCHNLELKTTALFEEQFVPRYLKSNSKIYKNKCDLKTDSLFPVLINKNIKAIANYEDSTITVINNTDTTITASFNNEWDYKKRGYPIGKLPPKSEKTFKIPNFIFLESQSKLFYFEAYRGTKLIKRG